MIGQNYISEASGSQSMVVTFGEPNCCHELLSFPRFLDPGAGSGLGRECSDH
ncbi:hypothetical protein BaRGS_00024828, partial [Batillaria attramentaria]